MEFLANKYTNWYQALIKRRQFVTPNGYVERHHIIPKSLGGSNLSENKIKLTAREHFICHLLLTKMTIGKDRSKMVYAAIAMKNFKRATGHQRNFRVNSRLFEKLRIERAKLVSVRGKLNVGWKHTSEARAKMSIINSGSGNGMFGKEHSDKTKEKLSEILSEKYSTLEWREKHRQVQLALNRKCSIADRRQISSFSPKTKTQDHRAKVAKALLGKSNQNKNRITITDALNCNLRINLKHLEYYCQRGWKVGMIKINKIGQLPLGFKNLTVENQELGIKKRVRAAHELKALLASGWVLDPKILEAENELLNCSTLPV